MHIYNPLSKLWYFCGLVTYSIPRIKYSGTTPKLIPNGINSYKWPEEELIRCYHYYLKHAFPTMIDPRPTEHYLTLRV